MRKAASQTTPPPFLRRSWLWGEDLTGTAPAAVGDQRELGAGGGVGGLLAVTRHSRGDQPAESYWATSDLNGNVIGLLATSSTKTAVYDYDPFGQPIRVNEPEAGLNPVRFSSKYTDAETGLCYYGYRLYSPELGRWLGRDPIGERGGLNLYGMVGNDAVGRWDYLGLYLLEVNRDTKLLVKSLGGGAISEQWMSLGQISTYLESQCCKAISIEAEGKVMVDTDGSGPSHNDPDQQNETSYKPGGNSLNADDTAYAVAPRIMSWDSGNGESILRPGDKASVSANGQTISAVVGDFGPNSIAGSENTTFGELSYKAVQDLGIEITITRRHGPVVGDHHVKVVYYPRCKKDLKK